MLGWLVSLLLATTRCQAQRAAVHFGTNHNHHGASPSSHNTVVSSSSSSDATTPPQRSVDLSFEGIRLTLASGKKHGADDRVLLDGSLRGRAQPGRMLAIMGPSGAGESYENHLYSPSARLFCL